MTKSDKVCKVLNDFLYGPHGQSELRHLAEFIDDSLEVGEDPVKQAVYLCDSLEEAAQTIRAKLKAIR